MNFLKDCNIKFFSIFLLLFTVNLHAATLSTHRIPQFSNDKVSVWKTVVLPSEQQQLKMHRHDNDRVVIALTSGTLKIINDKGKIHYLKLEKEKAYYLPKDATQELHTDQNISAKPIKVMVIELKNNNQKTHLASES